MVFEKIERFFFQFYTIFHFTEFCTMRYFEFLNSVLTKNLEMDSSFLEFLFQNFENFKFDQPVFDQYFNQWSCYFNN
jgi:hypothetical protein